MDRFRVVLADDVPELRRLLRHVLEWSERFEIVGEADNGKQAIQLARDSTPDLLLLDISMPQMDGMEALPMVLEASPSTKVVMLSGFEAERLAQAAIAQGASAYIEKGTPPAQLVSQLLATMGASDEDGDTSPEASAGVTNAATRTGAERKENKVSLTDFSSEEMMSLVAHEIRNPLAVIQGFGMELVNRWETMPEDVRRDAVRRMTERARYLNTVVSNLMYMRRVSADPQWVESTTEPVVPLLERMVDELRDMTKDNPLRLSAQDGLPPVKVNVQRLRQVLTNLIVNATKFSPREAEIVMAAEAHPRGVVVRIIDQGPGIPEDKREVVFEKFKRLEGGGSGIGLGLYISRALMEAMDGELWAESHPGSGASLACLLPVG